MTLPRAGNVAPPRWLLPTLPYPPRTQIGGGCSCNVGTWSSNEAHPEGEGGVQYKEASKVNSVLAAVEMCENSHGPVTLPL